jgi:hypothetical protein
MGIFYVDAGFEVDVAAFDVGVDDFVREWSVFAKPYATSEKLL